MDSMRHRTALVAAASLLLSACLLTACQGPPPYKTPVSVTPPTGRVAVAQAVTIFDASGSQEDSFADGKATLESTVAAMPDGSYEAGQVHFGGSKRDMPGFAAFDRGTQSRFANEALFLEGTSPLYKVIAGELTEMIGGSSGRAAVVVISDGEATDQIGRPEPAGATVAAAKTLADGRSGPTCFHTIQTGGSPAGAELLQALAAVTSCGSYRNASSLGSAQALQQFSRQAYLGGDGGRPRPAPTPVAGAVDSDGDGVIDSKDECPNTPKGARVDSRGCWTIPGLQFGVNTAELDPSSTGPLGEVVDVLVAEPGLRIRIDGHTDSDGSAAYNQDLSQRRAEAVRDHLVAQGLEPGRFQVKGFGESSPVVPNDSRANKQKNRRVELTILN